MDTDRARALLAAERERLERLVADLERPIADDESDDLDQADTASDLFQNEFDQGRAEDIREQLDAVARAEQRLADGTYGKSTLSGQPIPDERLEAVPAAELTADEERERGRG